MRAELLEGLWLNGMIKLGRFILTSGKESPYYVDLKDLPSEPKLFSEAIGELERMLTSRVSHEFGIASVELAGIPYGVALAFKMRLPFIYVRKRIKKHGAKKLIEGRVRKGFEYVVVDDVLTTGGSILHVVRALRQSGARVNLAVVLFDRMQGGRESLEKEGVEVLSLTTIIEAVDHLNSKGLMRKEDADLVKRYLESEGVSV